MAYWFVTAILTASLYQVKINVNEFSRGHNVVQEKNKTDLL